ncbi:MAG: maleylacetate reductase [Nocardioidaceae bacterium]
MRDFVHESAAVRVVFGVGTRAQVATEVERLGCRRVLIIHGRHEASYADEIEADLGGRAVGRFTDIAMHVSPATADAARAAAELAGANLLLVVGGGSAVGTAKAVALTTSLPILAVPTTYAGSEMTSIWGLTDGGRKTTGRDQRVQPRTVVYDPEVTVSLPAEVSAASGMNAVAHLVEALYAPGASPLLAVAAQDGIRALAAGLPHVVARPHDLEARSDALAGAWLAGWALGIATMGVHHKICHVLGGTWQLPHAATHAAVLPFATAFNAAAAPAAMERIRRALADAGRPAESAAGGLWDLATAIGAPTSLAAVGFSADSVDEAARSVVDSTPIHPREVDEPGVRRLLLAAIAGERPGAARTDPDGSSGT